MNGAWLPLWIIGGPFVGLLFLSFMFGGGTSASTAAEGRPLGRPNRLRAGAAGELSTSYLERSAYERSMTLDMIARLSGPVSPGAISVLSGHKSPGAISSLSGRRSPGAISKLSGPVSPAAISRLSAHKSPGAICELSKPRPVGAISKLSGGFYVSNLFGLPLLTRSQSPTEPDDSLLISEHWQRTDGRRP
jgi:hypothetical protein